MEKEPLETLNRIKALLEMLEDITVLDVAGTIDTPRIELRVESHQSHLLLVYCSEAANVHFDCWTQCKPWSDEAKSNPAKFLRYCYTANSQDNEPGEALESFNLLGAFLVWSMFEMKIIPASEEKKLVKKFNACSRSA